MIMMILRYLKILHDVTISSSCRNIYTIKYIKYNMDREIAHLPFIENKENIDPLNHLLLQI
jgi:hypothetical protein